MKRLTKIIDGYAHGANGVSTADCFKKLAEYEDLEEQGLLVKLPCKEIYESIGNNLYYIFDNKVIECINCGVRMSPDNGELWIGIVYSDISIHTPARGVT